MVVGPQKGKKKSNKSINTNPQTIRLVVIVVILLGASIALYKWANSYYQAKELAALETQKAELKAIAKGAAENVSIPLNTINSRMQTLVKNEKLLSLLAESDQTLLDNSVEDFSSGFPSLLKLRFFLPGQYKLDRDSTPPIGFASLDLLKRAERSNERIKAEILGFNSPDAHIVIIRRIMNDQNQLAGLLHLSLSADLLKNNFEKYDAGDVYVELLQTSGSQDMKLFAKGNESAKKGASVSIPINGTNWHVKVWYKSDKMPAAETAIALPVSSFQIGLITVIILIITGWFIFRSRQTTHIKGETVYGGSVKAIMEGEHPGLEKLVPDLPETDQTKPVNPATSQPDKNKEKVVTEPRLKPEVADKLKEISEIKAKIKSAKKEKESSVENEEPEVPHIVEFTSDGGELTEKQQESDISAGEINLDEYLNEQVSEQQEKTDVPDNDMTLSFSIDEEVIENKEQESDISAGEISLNENFNEQVSEQQGKTDVPDNDMTLSFSIDEEVIEDKEQDSGISAGEISLDEYINDQIPEQQDKPDVPDNDMSLSLSLVEEDIKDNKQQDDEDSGDDIKVDDNSLDFEMPSAQSGQKINAGIFRAYDIRGVVGETLTVEGIYEIGRAIGSEAEARDQTEIIVGRDGRISSQELANSLIKGIRDAGCNVIDINMVPTPVLYFATHYLAAKSGVMITGSHNGPEYNGLKIVLNNDTLSGDAIQSLYKRIVNDELSTGQGDLKSTEIIPDYIRIISEDIPVALGNTFKIVIDCGNGVAGGLAPELFRALGHDVIELFCDVDGKFPNHHPDPSQPENLQHLIEKVRQEKADIGLAFDGDGDRLGVVDGEGNIIWPDRQMILFARDVLSRNQGKTIIFDVKCSRYLKEAIENSGGKALMWKTGHSLIKSKMKEEDAPLAGEMSGHIFFKERWYGFDDALYAAARLIEILILREERPVEVFAQLPGGVSTPEIRIPLEEKYHLDFMQNLGKIKFDNATITNIDGIRADFADGWGLVRASNTSPCLTARFEAENDVALDRIKSEFRTLINKISPNLKVPF